MGSERGARGFNRTVMVYQLLGHNKPLYIGHNDKINAASTKGNYAEACKIISDKTGHRLSKGGGSIGHGYSMESKHINIYCV